MSLCAAHRAVPRSGVYLALLLVFMRRRRAHHTHEPRVCYLVDVVVGHGVLTVTSILGSLPATLAYLMMITTTAPA